jgi:hypothetical protein
VIIVKDRDRKLVRSMLIAFHNATLRKVSASYLLSSQGNLPKTVSRAEVLKALERYFRKEARGSLYYVPREDLENILTETPPIPEEPRNKRLTKEPPHNWYNDWENKQGND